LGAWRGRRRTGVFPLSLSLVSSRERREKRREPLRKKKIKLLFSCFPFASNSSCLSFSHSQQQNVALPGVPVALRARVPGRGEELKLSSALRRRKKEVESREIHALFFLQLFFLFFREKKRERDSLCPLFPGLNSAFLACYGAQIFHGSHWRFGKACSRSSWSFFEGGKKNRQRHSLLLFFHQNPIGVSNDAFPRIERAFLFAKAPLTTVLLR
jgi:hypothetical protein